VDDDNNNNEQQDLAPASVPKVRRSSRTNTSQGEVDSVLKTMVLGALDEAGGQAWLAVQAQKNPTAFLTLVGKVLPMTVTGAGGDGEEPASIRVTFG